MIVLDQWLMSPFHIGGTLLLLMILDLGLTRVGFRMKQQEFVKHYVSEIYEMNPLMQDMIHQTQPMSLKQIIGRIGLVILVIYVAVEYTGTWFLEFVTGNFVLGYINIELRALENIFIFRGLNNHPEYVEGQIKLDIRYQYLILRSHSLLYGFLWLGFYILLGRIFFFGGVIMSGGVYFGTFLWERASLKRLGKL